MFVVKEGTSIIWGEKIEYWIRPRTAGYTRPSQKVEQMDTLRYISEGGPYGTGRLVHAY